jgi:hypothetical protein
MKELTNQTPADVNPVLPARAFVNIYKDEQGRFISDTEYKSYNSAYENRDQFSTYVETVEIVRHSR